jgi:hypothetical protein
MLTNAESLCAEIRARRTCGEVTVTVESRAFPNNRSVADVIDAFVGNLGFVGIGDRWEEINRRVAETIAQRILHRDLAYNVEIMSAELACDLAARFLNLFTAQARYFTNGTLYQLHERFNAGVTHFSSFEPITEATFDTGVVCLDKERIGLLWVQDED